VGELYGRNKCRCFGHGRPVQYTTGTSTTSGLQQSGRYERAGSAPPNIVRFRDIILTSAHRQALLERIQRLGERQRRGELERHVKPETIKLYADSHSRSTDPPWWVVVWIRRDRPRPAYEKCSSPRLQVFSLVKSPELHCQSEIVNHSRTCQVHCFPANWSNIVGPPGWISRNAVTSYTRSSITIPAA
jgi:hypothetical protein